MLITEKVVVATTGDHRLAYTSLLQQQLKQQLPSPGPLQVPGLTHVHPHSPPPQLGQDLVPGGSGPGAGPGGAGPGPGGGGVGVVGWLYVLAHFSIGYCRQSEFVC